MGRLRILVYFGLILGFTAFSATAEVKNPDTFIFASYGTLRTLDPCVAYDTVSSQRLWNIYEPLVFFDGEHTDTFKPLLTTEVPTLENGGIAADGKTYTFTIRQGVQFHEGQTLTAEDVVYSFKRNMIADPDGGPMWMLLEALTGEGSTRDKEGKLIPGIFEKIDQCVEAQGNKVIFHLPNPYPPFMGILAYSSSVILNKAWCMANGCWDGDIVNAAQYNNPAPGHEPLQKITNGTNAYRMKSWEPNKEFVFEAFDGYWGGATHHQDRHLQICQGVEHPQVDAAERGCRPGLGGQPLRAGSQGDGGPATLRGSPAFGERRLFLPANQSRRQPQYRQRQAGRGGDPPGLFQRYRRAQGLFACL